MRPVSHVIVLTGILIACSDTPTNPPALPLSISEIRAQRKDRDLLFSAYVVNHQDTTAVVSVDYGYRGFNVIVREPGITRYNVWRTADKSGVSIEPGASISIPPRDSIEMTARWTAVAEPGFYEVSAEFLTERGDILGRTDRARTFEILPP
ncbi:MAG: hypothetical protein H7Z40_20450 [Phycisphaerae bacterium]|nr:hypothetical protein [Gemmatimonadaceae bacterium]